MTRLRPEQIVGGVLQSASVETLDRDSHIILRIFNTLGLNGFVERYGDTGEDNFTDDAGTIPQRLLMLNGDLVHGNTKESVLNATTQIAMFAPNDHAAVEVAYLTTLTRRPTPDESDHFTAKLKNTKGTERRSRLSDLCWTLLNARVLGTIERTRRRHRCCRADRRAHRRGFLSSRGQPELAPPVSHLLVASGPNPRAPSS